MMLRGLVITGLYELASAACRLADMLSGTHDNFDGPPIVDPPGPSREEKAAHHCEYADPNQCGWPGHRW